MPSIVYSCVVEPRPKYVQQLATWITTLVGPGGVPRADLFVHVLDGEHAGDVTELLAERGIAFAPMPRFGDGRFCNKVAQLRTPALRKRPYVALCDTDVAFAGNLEPWTGLARAAGKPVDGPNPPVEVLEELYRRAGFTSVTGTGAAARTPTRSTFANNWNGGVYLLRGDLLDELVPLWEKWALWTLEQQPLLGSQVTHADQISFGLAAWELREPLARLPLPANFPHAPAAAPLRSRSRTARGAALSPPRYRGRPAAAARHPRRRRVAFGGSTTALAAD